MLLPSHPVVGMSANYCPRPVKLFCNNYACESVGQGERRERPAEVRALETLGSKSFGASDEQRYVLIIPAPFSELIRELHCRPRLAVSVQGDHQGALGNRLN